MATILGDRREGATDRFHFNVFLHLDILGSLAFLLGGFGWPRRMEIDPTKFEHPKLYTILTRLGGPVANLLFAGIVASIIDLVMILMELAPNIFLAVAAVNVTVAVLQSHPHPASGIGDDLGGTAAGVAGRGEKVAVTNRPLGFGWNTSLRSDFPGGDLRQLFKSTSSEGV